MILATILLLVAAPGTAGYGEVQFVASADVFADASACRVRLEAEAGKAQAQRYDAVRGPYEIAEGDLRVHMVRAEGSGHRIWEHRCLGKDLSSRTWNHSMEAADEEFTLESAAAKAEWLKKDASKQ